MSASKNMKPRTQPQIASRLRRSQAKVKSNNASRNGRSELEMEMQWNALLGQQDLLLEEIKRGEECLEQALAELADTTSRLEEWPSYEKSCGRNCLPCLTELVSSNRRIERFLTGWLRRRRAQLDSVTEAIRQMSREQGRG